MAVVTTEQGFREAVTNSDPTIELANDISITQGPIIIRYNATVRSFRANQASQSSLAKAFSQESLLIVRSGGFLTIDDAILIGSSNSVGPLISVERNASLELTNDSRLLNNINSVTGGAIVNQGVITIDNSTISGNSSTSFGGAISNQFGGLITMNSGEIINNRANIEGGAIDNNNESSRFIMNGGRIANNTSTNNGAGIVNVSGGILELNGGSITQNNAGVSGGGVHNYFNSGGFLLTGTTSIIDNTAPSAPNIFTAEPNFQIGGQPTLSLAIADEPSIPKIISSVDGATLQLTNSSYLPVNPEGSRIIIAAPTPSYPVLTPADARAFIKPPVGYDDWEVEVVNGSIALTRDLPFTITYENTQGALNPNPTQYTAESLPITLLPLTLPGFAFLGWRDPTGNLVTEIPVGTTGNLRFIADFIPLDAAILFEANDAGGPPATNIPAPISFLLGEPAIIPQTIPIRPGFRFLSWNTAPDGSGLSYAPGQQLIGTGETITLYAQWRVVRRSSKPDYIKLAECCRALKRRQCH